MHADSGVMVLAPVCVLRRSSHARRRLFGFALPICFYTLLGINSTHHQSVRARSGQAAARSQRSRSQGHGSVLDTRSARNFSGRDTGRRMAARRHGGETGGGSVRRVIGDNNRQTRSSTAPTRRGVLTDGRA